MTIELFPGNLLERDGAHYGQPEQIQWKMIHTDNYEKLCDLALEWKKEEKRYKMFQEGNNGLFLIKGSGKEFYEEKTDSHSKWHEDLICTGFDYLHSINEKRNNLLYAATKWVMGQYSIKADITPSNVEDFLNPIIKEYNSKKIDYRKLEELNERIKPFTIDSLQTVQRAVHAASMDAERKLKTIKLEDLAVRDGNEPVKKVMQR
jgi:hypothetical protein